MSSANATASPGPAVFQRSDDGVDVVERVAPLAMGRLAELFNPSTIRVFASGDDSEVAWIAATSVPADMVDGHVFRDLSDKQFVGNAVSI